MYVFPAMHIVAKPGPGISCRFMSLNMYITDYVYYTQLYTSYKPENLVAC